MRKMFCAILCMVLCLSCAASLGEGDTADSGEPMIVVVDGDAAAAEAEPTAEPASSQQEQEPEQSSEPAARSSVADPAEEGGVRWSYAISLTALQSPYLMLVNADNLLDPSYEPSSLVKVTGVKRATSAAVYMEKTAATALQEMFEAAKQVTSYTYMAQGKGDEVVEKTEEFENGMILYLKSGYRSYGTQSTTYSNYLDNNNGKDNGFVAKPGASEHQTGLSADILNAYHAGLPKMIQEFKWTPEAQWMKENACYFGFILRYTEDEEERTGIFFEPWHYRYVGKEVASYITVNNMSLESFTDEAQTALNDFIQKGGNVESQLAYEESRLNAPPESKVLDIYGEDGDAEVSLVF